MMISLAALVLVLSACATPGGEQVTTTTIPVSGNSPGEASTTEIMVQATMHLLTNDTTFAPGHRFPTVLIVDHLKDGTPLTDGQIEALTTAVSNLGDVELIADQDDYITDDLHPTIDGAAIVTLGVPDIDGNEATIDMEMWCGGLCGIWLTYALEIGDAGWEVLGTVGPIAVS